MRFESLIQQVVLRKFLFFLLLLIITPLIAGIYGIVHDQLTYSISHEYYTKFKFYQFGFANTGNEAIFINPRLYVAGVGFLATWWMGIPVGLILALTGLRVKEPQRMFIITLKAIVITTIVAFLTGIIGLINGNYVLANEGAGWWLPENLINKKAFIAVGSMHNFSYLGGLTGLIAGIVYIVRQKK